MILLRVGILNFKFRIVFWNNFWGVIGRFEKRITISENKPPFIKTSEAQVNVGDKIQDQKIEKNIIEKSKGEAKIPKNIEAKAPEKIDKLVHEKIEAKSSEKNPTQKFRPKKGKENVTCSNFT